MIQTIKKFREKHKDTIDECWIMGAPGIIVGTIVFLTGLLYDDFIGAFLRGLLYMFVTGIGYIAVIKMIEYWEEKCNKSNKKKEWWNRD